jgi:hypothetical protein
MIDRGDRLLSANRVWIVSLRERDDRFSLGMEKLVALRSVRSRFEDKVRLLLVRREDGSDHKTLISHPMKNVNGADIRPISGHFNRGVTASIKSIM